MFVGDSLWFIYFFAVGEGIIYLCYFEYHFWSSAEMIFRTGDWLAACSRYRLLVGQILWHFLNWALSISCFHQYFLFLLILVQSSRCWSTPRPWFDLFSENSGRLKYCRNGPSKWNYLYLFSTPRLCSGSLAWFSTTLSNLIKSRSLIWLIDES